MKPRGKTSRIPLYGTLLILLVPLSLVAAESLKDVQPAGEAGNRYWQEFWQLIRFVDYNTRVVVLGTTLLGAAAGLVGSFTLLRKRALIGDALSHATLPGIATAFLVATACGANGKSLPILLCGALVSGLLGVVGILAIRNFTRLKEDAALGIVLSVFFGAGIALLGIIQKLPVGHAAGLEAFIYGKTASMTAGDAWLIGLSCLFCMIAAAGLFKELKLICFDEAFAGACGFPVLRLDILLMTLVIVVTIVGLQAVGLVLIIALMVIPAAAARFWTEDMVRMSLISAILGAVSCCVGAGVSAVAENLPSGATIVLASSFSFALSAVFGTRRGIWIRFLRRRRILQRMNRRHVLRGLYECLEIQHGQPDMELAVKTSVAFNDLLATRSWTSTQLRRALQIIEREGLAYGGWTTGYQLTRAGFIEATRLVHEHRLWEVYLITHADVAASKVDRDADAIEHVLEPELIAELETILDRRRAVAGVVASPHRVEQD